MSAEGTQYRAEIDGLRAIAIGLVIGFHAFPEWVPGGFIGVDIFFVISGFLITSLIVEGLKRKHFSFALFYGRRIRRIFPALLPVLALCFVGGWYLLLEDEFTALTRHIAAGAGFVSNLQLWAEAGYFDSAAESKPLLHLWSLGVEEQFYIVWPMTLYLGYRFRIPLAILFAFIAGISFLINVILISHDAKAAFYSPLTRVWELSVGGLLAVLWRDADQIHAKKMSSWLTRANFLTVCGIALIAGTLVELDQSKSFPGWWAALPVAGVALLIVAGPAAPLNRYLFANRVAVGIGLISYPLYLWHWPLLTFLRLVSPHAVGTLPRLAATGASVLAAIATYYIVEIPIRRSRVSVWQTTSLTALIAAIGVLGFAVAELHWPSRHANIGLTRVVNAMHDWAYPPAGFYGFYRNAIRFYRRDSAVDSVTLFIGDSNMEQYAPRVDALISARGQAVNSAIFATRGGCLPIPYFYNDAEWLCRAKMRTTFDLAADPRIDTIVLGAAWAPIVGEQKNNAELVASFGELLEFWGRRKRVFVVLPMPSGTEFDPRSMFEGTRFGELRPRQHVEQVALKDVLAEQAPVRALLIKIADAHGITAIDPLPSLCPHDICPTRTSDGDPLYLDAGHMRPGYVIGSGTYIDKTLQPLASCELSIGCPSGPDRGR